MCAINYWVLCVRTACRRQLAAELLAAVAAEDYAAAADIRARMRQVPRPVPHTHTCRRTRMHPHRHACTRAHGQAHMH